MTQTPEMIIYAPPNNNKKLTAFYNLLVKTDFSRSPVQSGWQYLSHTFLLKFDGF
jgi:hypothetical protein